MSDDEILEENNYYPFGLKHKGYNNVVNGLDHYYDYLSQERQEELGINWISYMWRNGDPALGRFFNIDPIAEDYPNQTVYQFAANNPVWKIEVEGLEGWETTINDLINGLGYGTSNADGSGASHTGDYESGFIEAAFDGFESVVGVIHGGISEAVSDVVREVIGEAEYSNNLPDFNEAMESGSENDVYDSLSNEVAALQNAIPEAVGEFATMVAGIATGEILAGAKFSKNLGKTTTKSIGKSTIKSTALANYYPASNGALGGVTNKTLKIGQKIDRFGNLGGKYFSPTGTPLLKRALPSGANTSIYNSFEVTKPFIVQESVVAPAFGKVGTGTQYFLPFLNADELLKGGFIKSY